MELKIAELEFVKTSPYLYKAIYFNVKCEEIENIELLGFEYNNIKNIYETIFNINSSIFNITIAQFNSSDNSFDIKYECINTKYTKYKLISQIFFNEKICSNKIIFIKANIIKWINDITIILNKITFIQNYLKNNNINILDINDSNIHYNNGNYYHPKKLMFLDDSGFYIDGMIENIPYINDISILNEIITYLNNLIKKEEEDVKNRITFKKFIKNNDITTNTYI
jgi:hypothetical protein